MMFGFARFAYVGLLTLVFAGCAKGPASAVTVELGNTASVASRMRMDSATVTPAKRHTFAALPDRGELVNYPGNVLRQDGAYTWHRTELSEVHALHAIGNGHLRVTTPSGQMLDFQYDDHVEHPSGDWTWVGHIAGHPDQQTILTFGQHAAFGSIAQPGKLPLRLTVRNGVSWLVETDPRKVAGIVNAATRPQHPDFFVPPKAAATSTSTHTATAPAVTMASAPGVASAPTSATTAVDLVLGYTSAFASDNGGTSGAVTHMNYLVDVTNVAYVNSQIDAKVRLVATVLVNYPDATSNDTTLEQLTGYSSASNVKTTPDPAFNGLRAARDQYGADLVSMVRSFRETANGGCGVGWLIGGGRSGIATSDEYFGYSVVSDGRSVGADGKTYYCVDETLAHELGHNMGAAHDVATAKGTNGVLDPNEYGAFSYSFGYKSTAGNFYTVMAYGDSGQQIYRTFSNPRTTFCGGAICGITDQSDNARTLTQTIPIVATFRATVVVTPPPISIRPRVDMNGDGKSDIVWRNPTSGQTSRWYMNGSTRIGGALDSMSSNFRIVGIGDFDGDGRSDLLWEDSANSYLLMWFSGADGQYRGSYVDSIPAGWSVAGVADMNGDHTADIVLRNTSLGQTARWYMSGATRIGSAIDAMPANYRIIGIGDFDGDGRGDLLWTDSADSYLLMWLTGADGQYRGSYVDSIPSGWSVAGVGDMNGDGTTDIVWRNATAGQTSRWYMQGATRIGGALDAMPGNYRIIGINDFDGDGRGDLLWADSAYSYMLMWFSGADGQYRGTYVDSIPAGWSVTNGTY